MKTAIIFPADHNEVIGIISLANGFDVPMLPMLKITNL